MQLEVPERFEIWGDADRLEQVFINLIGNAVRHNPVGTPIEIAMTQPEDLSKVHVEVRDQGVGMPPDAISYLNSLTSERDRDRGLGLRLVRGLINAHGGRVKAVKAPQATGGGTVVAIELSIEDPDEQLSL